MDSSSNIYEVDNGTNSIIKITPSGVESTFATGFNNPLGITIDVNGNIYVCNNGAGNIIEVTPSGVESTLVASISGNGAGAFDANGNLYLAVNHGVDEITQAGVVSAYASSGSISQGWGVTFGLSGTIYEVDKVNGVVDSISTSGVVSSFATGMTNISGITYDPVNGDLYTCGSGKVYQITSSGTVSVFSSAFNNPRDLLYDPTPEPSTWALLIFGGAFLLFVVWQQKRQTIRSTVSS